jgi:hypothetical protein
MRLGDGHIHLYAQLLQAAGDLLQQLAPARYAARTGIGNQLDTDLFTFPGHIGSSVHGDQFDIRLYEPELRRASEDLEISDYRLMVNAGVT